MHGRAPRFLLCAGMDDPHEWRVKRSVNLVAELAAQAATAMPTVQAIDAAQMAELKGMGAKAQGVARQMAQMTADVQTIMIKCGDDEACLTREAQETGAAMHGTPTPKGAQQRQLRFRVNAAGGGAHERPFTVALKRGWRSQSGQQVVKVRRRRQAHRALAFQRAVTAVRIPLNGTHTMTMQMLAMRCATALAIAVASVTAVQAQVSVAGSVAPPMRADMSLNGEVVDSRDSGSLATCHSLCRSRPGCTGFTFHRPAPAAKATCRQLAGPLTDTAQVGTVSCRMPCEAGPRASVLPPKLPTAILRAPEAATLSVPARLAPPPAPVPPPPASGAKK